MMKGFYSVLFFTAILAGWAGCSSSKQLVVHRHNNGSFSGLKTYDIIYDDSVESRAFMRKVLVKEMDKMGYELDTLNPDFYLAFAGKLDVRYGIQRISPGMYGPGWGWYGGAPYYPYYQSYEYLESVLVIDFLDLQNERILWQGSYSERVSSRPSKKKIADAVESILKQHAMSRR